MPIFEQDHAHAAELARHALRRLDALELPRTPELFTVFYALRDDRRADLAARLRAWLGDTDADLDMSAALAAYDEIFGAAPAKLRCREMLDRLGQSVDGLSDALGPAADRFRRVDGLAREGRLVIGEGALSEPASGILEQAIKELEDMSAREQSLIGRLALLQRELSCAHAELEGERRHARLDALSGLANRRSFDERLKREVESAKGHRAPLALVLLDLDHFKRLNDGYGHLAGDKAIAQIGRLLASSCQAQGLAARIGGEEFAAILPGFSRERAWEFAEGIRDEIAATPIEKPDGTSCPAITASFGVANLMDDQDSVAALLERADRALYRAKRSGRNRVAVV
jgi:diguanylate cyclase (GGDEF)-like protein